jgi:signal transduction histidine kinase/ABC-type amino acid transport substrate-binding protein
MGKNKRLKNLFVCGAVAILLMVSIVPLGHGLEREILKVGISTNVPPLSFVSWLKTGIRLRGLHVDVLEQVAHHLKVEFQYIKCSSIEMQWQYLMSGKIDIIGVAESGLVHSGTPEGAFIPLNLDQSGWIFVHKSCRTIVCAKDLGSKQVAVLAGSKATDAELKDSVPANNIHHVTSALEGLTLLESGMVDAFVAPSVRVAGYLIQKQGLKNIRKVGVAFSRTELGMVIKQGNPRFSVELSRAAAVVRNSGTLARLKAKWYGTEFKQSFIKRYYPFIAGGFLLVLMVLGAVAVLNRQLKKKVKAVTGQLKASEHRYRNLIESSPDMIFVVNRSGKIYQMNREARFFMPSVLPPTDAVLQLKELFSPGDLESLEAFLASVFNREKSTMEFKVRNSKFGYRELEIAATLLPSCSAEPTEDRLACFFSRDVTQRNKIERDLVQADRMNIIGQMAADVAHEINNPIGIILANIDLILDRGWFSPEAREFLESCKRNTLRAGDFTRDLLAIATPKTPEMKTLNLWDLICSSLDMMGAQLRRIRIQKKNTGELPLVQGDWNLLQQVLVNLLLNAAAAMAHVPEPLLQITCCAPENSGMVRIRVEDGGVGIPLENLSKVFEPFFTKGKKEGLGLGLFISRRIVNNHDGVIYVESEVDRGTEFIIEMPLTVKEG